MATISTYVVATNSFGMCMVLPVHDGLNLFLALHLLRIRYSNSTRFSRIVFLTFIQLPLWVWKTCTHYSSEVARHS